MKRVKSKRTTIPIHKLQERTALGIQLRYFTGFQKEDLKHLGAHRDDHYIFILQKQGKSNLNLDFRNITVEGSAVFFILPGQVHYVPESQQTAGWFMAIDSSLVEKSYNQVFEEQALHQQSLEVGPEKLDQLVKCMELLSGMFDDSDQPSMPSTLIHSLASVYVGLFADLYSPVHQKKINKT
ncbi:AraC family ligand binding domain-containing protein [Pedobacter sp. NJ-S-72]